MAYKNFGNYNAFVKEATFNDNDNKLYFHMTYRELYNMLYDGLPVFFTYKGDLPNLIKHAGVYYPIRVVLPVSHEDNATVDFPNGSTSGLIDSEIVWDFN